MTEQQIDPFLEHNDFYLEDAFLDQQEKSQAGSPALPNELFTAEIVNKYAALYEDPNPYDQLDGFNERKRIDAKLRAAIGEDPEDGSPYISHEHMNARRDFLIGTLEYFADRQAKITSKAEADEVQKLANVTEHCLFSGSPNASDYIGNITNMLDVLQVADRCPYFKRMQWELTENAMQGLTFSKNPAELRDRLVTKVVNSEAVDQLRTLRQLNRLARNASSASYGDTAAQIIYSTYVDTSDQTEGLTRIVASALANELGLSISEDEPLYTGGEEIHAKEQFVYTHTVALPPRFEGLYTAGNFASDMAGLRNRYGGIDYAAQGTLQEQDDTVFVIGNCLEQLQLHPRREVQAAVVDWLSDKGQPELANKLRSVNPEMARDLLQQQIDTIPKQQLDPRPLEDVLTSYVPEDQVVRITALLQEMHQPAIREFLETRLGCSLPQLSLEAQIQFLQYVASADEASLDHLIDVANMVGDEHPDALPAVYESFLAIEHDVAFGSIILDIAEYMEPSEAAQLLTEVGRFRSLAKDISDHFADFDMDFSTECKVGLSKRLTELLATIQAAATNGGTASGELYGKPVTLTKDQIKQAVTALTSNLTMLNQALRNPAVRELYDEDGQLSAFALGDEPNNPATVTAQLRRTPTPNGEHRRDLEFDGESRINFLIANARSLADGTITPSPSMEDTSRTTATSIRFDRDGTMFDDDGSFAGRDNQLEQATASIDIGLYTGTLDDEYSVMAAAIAIGNQILSTKRNQRANLWHIRDTFNPKFGTIDGFAKLHDYLYQEFKSRAEATTAAKAGRAALSFAA